MEILDLYDNNGKKINKIIVRDKNIKLLDNEHIAVSVIYIENNKDEFLIQKTSKEKGGLYSSTGGHVNSGETPLECIKRKVSEELGININNENIKELGYINYDMPIRFIFYLKKDINLKDIKTQKEEVEYIQYMNKNEIETLINKGKFTESHGKIFKEILKYKNVK